MKIIKIKTQSLTVTAVLIESKTAEAIWNALPFESEVNTWGDEIYFEIPLSLQLENGKRVVQVGDLAYWPEGNCFCIFFGTTPISTNGEIRPASAVSVFGRLTDEPSLLKKVKAGENIRVERA